MGERFSPLAREMREKIPEFLYPFREIKILGPREAQQDYSAVKVVEIDGRRFQVNIVADGNGDSGELCAERAVKTILSEIENQPELAREEKFEELFDKADKDVESLIEPGGTTLSLVTLQENSIIGAYVGDSDVRIVSKDGRFTDLTMPHRVDNLDEERRITELGGQVIQMGRNKVKRLVAAGKNTNLSRTIGHHEMRPYLTHKPEIFGAEIQPADKYLLVASDGFWEAGDGFEEEFEELGKLLARAKSIDEAERLVRDNLAKKRQGDNITLQIIELNKKSE